MMRFLLIICCLTLSGAPLYAHEAAYVGFSGGLLHPILGVDHLLAMLSVGIVSAQIGKQALWAIPLLFVSVMAAGSMYAYFDFYLPSVELGIASSVIFLGVAIACQEKLSAWVIAGFVAVFALFHGYAHGVERPESFSFYIFGAGFLLGTACIHVGGLFIPLMVNKFFPQRIVLAQIGAAVAAVGVYLLLGNVGVI